MKLDKYKEIGEEFRRNNLNKNELFMKNTIKNIDYKENNYTAMKTINRSPINPVNYNMDSDIENINENLSDQFQMFRNMRDQSPMYSKSPCTPNSPFNEISEDEYRNMITFSKRSPNCKNGETNNVNRNLNFEY